MKFTANGHDFFPIGGQSHNSSAYNNDEIASAVAGVTAIGGNTLEAPVYWEHVEREAGLFDFSSVDALITACVNADLKLIILWFGTWKNGEMRYVPEWVKNNTDKFKRVLSYDNNHMAVLSSYCNATKMADGHAFSQLCQHLAAASDAAKTVIAIQVENEPGILGSDRDHSETAERAIHEPVPDTLIQYIKKQSCGQPFVCWQKNGFRKDSDWLQTFGHNGYEYREAWSIASFIDSVAEEGQKHFKVPMYTNAWLGGDGWQVPGFYPSGGPIAALLDIWKPATPHLETIAPDIYIRNSERFRAACADYAREDNCLFVPESGANDNNAMNMIKAIADYNAVGYACFAVDSVVDLQGNIRPQARLFADSVACTAAMLPLILKHQRTGKIHAVYHEEDAVFLPLQLERFKGMIPYVDMGLLSKVTDHRHGRRDDAEEHKPCFGYVIEENPFELYLSGQFHLHLVPNEPPGWTNALRFPILATPPDFLSVEEGVFDSQGRFTASRKRNGDEVVFGGFWAAPDVGVVRVRLTPRGE